MKNECEFWSQVAGQKVFPTTCNLQPVIFSKMADRLLHHWSLLHQLPVLPFQTNGP